MQIKRNLGLIVACLAFASMGRAQLATEEYPAYTSGRFSSTGGSSASNPNYLTGRLGESSPLDPSSGTYAGFVVFNIPQSPRWRATQTTYTSSWLRSPSLDGPSPLGAGYSYAWQAINGVSSVDDYQFSAHFNSSASLTLNFTSPGSQTSTGLPLTVFDVLWSNAYWIGSVSFGGRTDIFADLTSGVVYGETVPPGGPFSMSLNAGALNAVLALNDASGGRFGLGFSLAGAAEGEYVFGFSGDPIGISLTISGERTTAQVVQNTTETFSRFSTGGSPNTPLFGPNQDIWYTNDPNTPPSFMAIPEPKDFALIGGVLLLAVGMLRRVRA